MNRVLQVSPVGALAWRLPAAAIVALFLLVILGRPLALCLDAGCDPALTGAPCASFPAPVAGDGECPACARDAGCGREVADGEDRTLSRGRRDLDLPPGAAAGAVPPLLFALPSSGAPHPWGAAPRRGTPFALLSAPLRC